MVQSVNQRHPGSNGQERADHNPIRPLFTIAACANSTGDVFLFRFLSFPSPSRSSSSFFLHALPTPLLLPCGVYTDIVLSHPVPFRIVATCTPTVPLWRSYPHVHRAAPPTPFLPPRQSPPRWSVACAIRRHYHRHRLSQGTVYSTTAPRTISHATTTPLHAARDILRAIALPTLYQADTLQPRTASGSVRFRFEPIFEPDLASTSQVVCRLRLSASEELLTPMTVSVNFDSKEISMTSHIDAHAKFMRGLRGAKQRKRREEPEVIVIIDVTQL
ncbi:hypothetical protein K438DRAFT_1968797 [Mycena galopus ATCC 62051]|nr:hypothetical protein K438DRAFT_1968797 [Mycena galopus ATCC 62051]